MKFKKLLSAVLFVVLFLANVLPVSAETTTVPETTTAEEKTTERETTPAEEKTTDKKTTEEPSSTREERIYISFKSGDLMPEYVYTGKKIKPEVVVKKEDKTIVDKSEYTLEYDGDLTNPGVHTIYAVYKKNGYKIGTPFWIVPGTTDKIDVKVKNGIVTVSWKPVPGAGAYRVYKYDDSRRAYIEMWWSAEEIASAKTSRTFTTSELRPGGKYKMAIMALPAINSMPTKQMAYFTVDTTKDTVSVQKPVTTAKPAEKTTSKADKHDTTVNPLEITTITEETGTTLIVESTTAIPDEESVFESVVETVKTAEDNASDNEKDNSQRTKIIIISIVIILSLAGIVFTVYKKKK